MARPGRPSVVLAAVALLLVLPLLPVANRSTAAAETRTDLPLQAFADVAVDGTHRHLFFSQGTAGPLAVIGFDGTVVKTLDLPGTATMVLDGNESTLYVALLGGHGVSAIDTSTLIERRRYSQPQGIDVSVQAWAADRLWGSAPCAIPPDHYCLASMDPASGSWTATDTPFPRAGRIAANPADPTRIAVRGQDVLTTFAVSGPAATTIGSHRVWWHVEPEVGLSPDKVVYTLEDTEVRAFRADDLARAGIYTVDGQDAGPFSLSRDATLVAVDDHYNYDGSERIALYRQGAGWPDQLIGVPQDEDALRLAFAPDGGTLFAVSRHYPDGFVLHVIDVNGRIDSELTATAPDSTVVLPQEVVVTGALRSKRGGVPLPGRTLAVQRAVEQSPEPPVDLSPVVTGPDGSFRFTDQPPPGQRYVYTISWNGDAKQGPASGSTAIYVGRYATRVGPTTGTNPYDWSAKVIHGYYFDGPLAWWVVLANPANFQAAASAATLAAAGESSGSPLFFTGPTSLPPAVRSEIRSALAPGRTVYIVGDLSDVGQGVEAQLRQDGYAVRRISGSTHAQTSVAVAEEVMRVGSRCQWDGPTTPTATLTSTDPPSDEPDAGWVDVVMGVAWSNTHCLPLLLTPPDALDPAVGDFLRRHQIEVTVVIGRTVSASVERQVPGPIRIAGADRFETAVAVHRDLFGKRHPGDYVTVFNGDRADGAAYLLLRGADLPVHADSLPDPVKLYVTVACRYGMAIFGGEDLVSAALERQIATEGNVNCPYLFGPVINLVTGETTG